MATAPTWTLDDYMQNRCTWEQYQPDSPPPTEPDVLNAVPEATMAEFKRAMLEEAFNKEGFRVFARKNPQFHQKALLAMMKDQLPQERPTVEVNISWLSNDRLAYKQGALLEDSGESKALEVQDIPWKEDPTSPYQKAFRDFERK